MEPKATKHSHNKPKHPTRRAPRHNPAGKLGWINPQNVAWWCSGWWCGAETGLSRRFLVPAVRLCEHVVAKHSGLAAELSLSRSEPRQMRRLREVTESAGHRSRCKVILVADSTTSDQGATEQAVERHQLNCPPNSRPR